MRGKERKALAARLDAVNTLVDKIDRNVERIELATVLREPNTKLSVDAYDGLRKQVVAAASERAAHLHQLAEFDSALDRGASLDDLRTLVGEWLGQAGIQVVTDPFLEDAYELVGEGSGDLRVVRPAYVDTATGRLVRRGIAERIDQGADIPNNGRLADAESESASGESAEHEAAAGDRLEERE
jgi:hypothetical protein